VANRGRQEILAIEEAFRTDAFPARFQHTLLGMIFVNTHDAAVYFHGETRDLKSYLRSLTKECLTNTIDEEVQGAAPEAGTGAAGAPSPLKETQQRHTVVPLSSVGFLGASQLTCAVCKAKTTACCLECSTADAVLALCKPVHKYKSVEIRSACLRCHVAAPDAQRKSTPRLSGAQKRARSPSPYGV
jgi:hypothetical protein